MVEALIGREVDDELLDGVAGEISAPHLLDIEVLSALRGLVLGGKIDQYTADEARRAHFSLSITRHITSPLADRIWHLRHRYTAYDASYLALAEALDAPLYTCDAKLAGGGHDAVIRVLGRTS